jgi:ParB family chromosome partitioning protein
MAEQQPQGTLKHIKIADIRENPDALRSVNRSSEGYIGLVDSIKEVGVLKPVNVREVTDREDPSKSVYGLIDGLHRFTAAQDAGLETIPAYVLSMNDGQVLEAQIMANVHKIETKPAEYSQALLRLLGANPTLTISELSKKLAKSPKWLSDRLSITKLHEKIQALVDEGKVNLTYALAKFKDPQEQLNFLDRAMTESPQVFIPLVTNRVKEINEAKRKGKDQSPEEFKAIPHLRKLKEVEDELTAKRMAEQFRGAGKIQNPADFLMGVMWASHMDPDSVEEAKRKWEQKKQERDEAKKKAKLERAQKQQAEAAKVLSELGKNGEPTAQEDVPEEQEATA